MRRGSVSFNEAMSVARCAWGQPMSSKYLLKFALMAVCGAFVASFVAIFSASSAGAKDIPAWHIKQVSYNLGNVEIIIAKDSMRWHNEKVGLTFLVKGPDWKLYALNETNKKYLAMDKSEALEVFQHQRRRDNSGIDAPVRIDKSMVIAGMPTVCYLYAHSTEGVTTKFAAKVTHDLEHGVKLNAAQKKYVDNVLKHERREYWLSRDIAVSPQISGIFLENIVATNYGDSLPLRLVQIGRDGARTTMLDTREVKKVSVNPDIFRLPRGYTKAENKIALLVNDSEFDGMDGEPSPGSATSKLKSGKHDEVHR